MGSVGGSREASVATQHKLLVAVQHGGTTSSSMGTSCRWDPTGNRGLIPVAPDRRNGKTNVREWAFDPGRYNGGAFACVLTGMIACADVEPERNCFETRRSVFRWKVPGTGRRGRRSVGESRLVRLTGGGVARMSRIQPVTKPVQFGRGLSRSTSRT
jgi:hypothetical protein